MSSTGFFIALIFLAFSLTPSLLPRLPLIQGVLSGIVFAVGYWTGCLFIFLWRYLELPETKNQYTTYLQIVCSIVVGASITYAFSHWTMWQNSILQEMGQGILQANQSIPTVVGVAFVIANVLILTGYVTIRLMHFIVKQVYKFIPRRISHFIGIIIAISLTFGLVNGVLIEVAFNTIDSGAAKVNQLTDTGVAMPINTLKTGSDESFIAWNTLGREGRNFIANGPSAEKISSFTGESAIEPLRVYVGLESANSVNARAELALTELKRIHAFDRSVLIITTPTGTGWMDPNAVDSIEYIHGGDTVNVGIQYSYLSSQSTLLFLPTIANKTSEAMFHTIYNYWKTLPQEARPKLYLFGLSLGSFGSEHSAKLHEIIEEPISGALWAGPPFVNDLHRDITNNRNANSPAWLPTYGDGSLVRFTSKDNNLDNYESEWGMLRLIYIQHATDAISFFSPNLFYKKPDWLIGERGPDVSPFLHWQPVVTFFQILFDLTASVQNTPIGHGHHFSPNSYIDSWVSLTDPPNWDDRLTVKLKELFAK
jgi:uncharacterized membrane protein